MPSDYTIPGLGNTHASPTSTAATGRLAGTWLPQPTLQFQNGQMPTITLDELNAYAASMPSQFWSQFTDAIARPEALATNTTPADSARHHHAQASLEASILPDVQFGAVTGSNEKLLPDPKSATTGSGLVSTTQVNSSPKSTRNSRRKKRASLLQAATLSTPIVPGKSAQSVQTALTTAATDLDSPTTMRVEKTKAEAVAMLRDLYSRGVRFEEFQRRGVIGLQIDWLRDLFREADLPLPPLPVKKEIAPLPTTAKPELAATINSRHESKAAEKPKPLSSDPAKQKLLAPLVDKQVQAQSREEYLARLQAIRGKTSNRTSDSPAPISSPFPKPEIQNNDKIQIQNETPRRSSSGRSSSMIPGLSNLNPHVDASATPNPIVEHVAPVAAAPPVAKPNISNELTEKIRQKLAQLKKKVPTESREAVSTPSRNSEAPQSPAHPIPKQSSFQTPPVRSAIPGLFMDLPRVATQPATPVRTIDTESNSRKRPVAADYLDSEPQQIKKLYTSDKESCVIDLTDDESSDGEEMDLDTGHDVRDVSSTSQSSAPAQDIANTAMQSTHKASTAMQATSKEHMETKNSKTVPHLALLEAKEKAIAAMKQRLAAKQLEHERRVALPLQTSSVDSTQNGEPSPAPVIPATVAQKASSTKSGRFPAPQLPSFPLATSVEDTRKESKTVPQPQQHAKIGTEATQGSPELQRGMRDTSQPTIASRAIEIEKVRPLKKMEVPVIDTKITTSEQTQDTKAEIQAKDSTQFILSNSESEQVEESSDAGSPDSIESGEIDENEFTTTTIPDNADASESSEEGEVEDSVDTTSESDSESDDQSDLFVRNDAASTVSVEIGSDVEMDPVEVQLEQEAEQSESVDDPAPSHGLSFSKVPPIKPISADTLVYDDRPAKQPSPPREIENRLTGMYAPYESALKRFKAYRFHPEYLQNVQGGFKSTTYSHLIDDSTTPLCPTELDFGTCNDKMCGFQHLTDMTMPDNSLLVDLGKPFPSTDPEKLAAWRHGLRQVLYDLQSKGDPDTITVVRAIMTFRRSFLDDDSRILNLGDI